MIDNGFVSESRENKFASIAQRFVALLILFYFLIRGNPIISGYLISINKIF